MAFNFFWTDPNGLEDVVSLGRGFQTNDSL